MVWRNFLHLHLVLEYGNYLSLHIRSLALRLTLSLFW